jgi:hypothetical protein
MYVENASSFKAQQRCGEQDSTRRQWLAYRFERLVTTNLLKRYAFTTSANI